jgi:hypothetical protein
LKQCGLYHDGRSTRREQGLDEKWPSIARRTQTHWQVSIAVDFHDIRLEPEMISYQHFRADEEGAVSVDWIVLTAAIVGLCFLVTVPAIISYHGAANTAATSLVETVEGIVDD